MTSNLPSKQQMLDHCKVTLQQYESLLFAMTVSGSNVTHANGVGFPSLDHAQVVAIVQDFKTKIARLEAEIEQERVIKAYDYAMSIIV